MFVGIVFRKYASCIFFLFLLTSQDVYSQGAINFSGVITPESYLLLKEAINKYPDINEVVLNSSGGDIATAMAMGKLIKSHKLNIRIEGMCLSACANYLFIAGGKKFIKRNAMLGFHGGWHQEGILEWALSIPVGTTIITHGGSVTNNGSSPPDYILHALGINTPKPSLFEFGLVEKEYFASMKVNPDLPTFGQKGIYEDICLSRKYRGFYYDIESLKNMGIDNIEIEGGSWQPEVNRIYHDFYEVNYPQEFISKAR